MNMEKSWNKIATVLLKNKTIVEARYMTRDEADSMGWRARALVITLDDGTVIYPMADDEGNEAGSLRTNSAWQPILPII